MLVPGRECGDCTVCCEALSIDAATLRKPSGILCHHNSGTGCTNYGTRPDVCRDWFCAWRMADMLDDSWRPDKSGVLVEIGADSAPDGFYPPVLRFTLLRTVEDVVWPPFVDLVTLAIARRQAVYLYLVGPPGHFAARTFLNVPALVAAVDALDRPGIEQGLRRAGDRLTAHHWEKIPA
jgi:hypothetical protein